MIVYKQPINTDTPIPMKLALTLSLIPLALFIALSMPNYARDSLATAVAVEYDSRVATLDRHIHAMMRNSAVVSYRKFNHNMKKVEESLLVARVGIMHSMRKSLDHLEDLVFEEPFIQTSQYNVIELQSRNYDILMPNTARLVAKTIAVRKGVWVVRMEEMLDKLQEELSDEGRVGDLDATNPKDTVWSSGIIPWVMMMCTLAYIIYLRRF